MHSAHRRVHVIAHLRAGRLSVGAAVNKSCMRTIPTEPNQTLRYAMRLLRDDPSRDDVHRAAVNRLLASTMVVTHDGTLELEDDGSLPTGTALPLGICRDADDTFQLTAFTDQLALEHPDSPTGGDEMPTVAISGDDLVVLAASNGVGIHINPGSDESMVLPLVVVRQASDRIHRLREDAGVRVFDDNTLVTLRPTREIDPALVELFVHELRGRGAHLAYVAEYSLHDRMGQPDEFTQIIVVGNEDGAADFDLREDARTVLAYLTGLPTDSVAFNSMPQVQQVVEPVMVDGELPYVAAGVV